MPPHMPTPGRGDDWAFIKARLDLLPPPWRNEKEARKAYLRLVKDLAVSCREEAEAKKRHDVINRRPPASG